MSFPHPFQRPIPGWAATLAIGVALGAILPALADQALQPPEAAFMTENDAAMARMMAAMTIKPTGDVDRDFVAMMVPHHQGAIDMAQAVLRYGKNEHIRRLAQEIIVDQMQEIAAMRLAIGEPLPPSSAAPTAPASPPSPDASVSGMTMPKMP
ncbi:MAG TPA: DUF305 domain-containing protein [Candidatus Cybelea sp.]|nr:DUF305 domain-containing protein [Candidatus Cybelea sp.]